MTLVFLEDNIFRFLDAVKNVLVLNCSRSHS
jgi:hypothetical protein